MTTGFTIYESQVWSHGLIQLKATHLISHPCVWEEVFGQEFVLSLLQ